MLFRYPPLRKDKDEIRLLEISLIKSRDRISFRLFSVPLNEAPLFWAVSYTWGDPSQRRAEQLQVNNHSFMVSPNLFHILYKYVTVLEFAVKKDKISHLLWKIRYVWVDAICINQADFAERAQQIQIMGRIYQTGKVGVFLDSDPSHEGDKAAREALQEVCTQVTQGRGPVHISDDCWVALHDFFAKGWFHRMWVIQECIFGGLECSIWVHYIPLTESEIYTSALGIYEMATISLVLSTEQRRTMLGGISQYLALQETKRHRISNGGQSSPEPPGNFLATLLWKFRDRLATDPRDKVYSLLGLVGTADRDNIIVDYQAPVEDVFASVVRAVVLSSKSLNIICACQNAAGNNMRRSWVPDWAEPWRQSSLLTDVMNRHMMPDYAIDERKYFRASGDERASVTVSEDLLTLTSRGMTLGRVVYLADTLSNIDSEKSVLDSSIDLFNDVPIDFMSLVIKKYGDVSNFDPESQENEVITAWVAALHGGPYSLQESRALHFHHFHKFGASQQWHLLARTLPSGDVKGGIDNHKQKRDLEHSIRILQIGHGRRIFIADTGHCGLLPEHAQVGDLLCILFGCDAPVVLRPQENKDGDPGYVFVGECYALGLMYGEAIDLEERRNGEREVQDFKLM
ncbi:heterokaryon incompatibility protein-domain-containing protein [Podospora didyma]|uniref:Heterokaryon incompatibility protein-domain-containing protein n=1 Tax=Podospora didyma TaxID=330526 RepID=A0AAE0NTV9_9PEZI|nr:heterokaryon incompatibility protein-domain-containing protein [Podospora didyma]